ncbi:unnamed protein product [Zymoseptoria tritici ST99CH_1A5]|uniref:Uncharacterized protein n=2 Tax=Zymoseptoria tritici TaxID=1047171 RepID=A0A2H1H8V7_ZYMTR|nr:unnamed protein product [Zymoseptoria tritici ST99CH_1E4]SMY30101.1 unnamed protein product [Zymoseptoria tritici ST99CH_1A5]
MYRSWERSCGYRRDLFRDADWRDGPRKDYEPTAEPSVPEPPDDDTGIAGSFRLYKRAARASLENGPLLPTQTAQLQGLSDSTPPSRDNFRSGKDVDMFSA